MKTLKTNATIKLIKRIDSDLKNLLMNDLKIFKERVHFLNGFNNQVTAKQLAAA